MPNPAPVISRKSGWSPARRAAQAEAIRRWKPWANSTGPKTAAGKARAAQNAAKPHTCHIRHAEKLVKNAMAAQARYITDIKAYTAALKIFAPNELLKNHLRAMHKRLKRQGQRVTNRLQAAFLCLQLVEQLAQRPPLPRHCEEQRDEAIHLAAGWIAASAPPPRNDDTTIMQKPCFFGPAKANS